MEVSGSVVVITGGGSGIGAAVAKDLAKEGAKIAVAGRRIEPLNAVVEEIKANGGEAIAVATDITDENSVAHLMDATVEAFGKINVVHANAGAISDSLVINTDKATGKVRNVMTVDQFRKVIDTNLVGTFLTLREGARRMVDNQWKGVMIITSSINSTGQLGQLNYSSTKAALTLWPKILVGEFNVKGVDIRVVGISPGYTATEILSNMKKEVLDTILKDVHVHHLVEPNEIASTVKHIIENESIDATTIEITGGLTFGPRSRAK